MRTTTLVLAVLLSTSTFAAGQEADEYANTKDGFKIYSLPLSRPSKTSRGYRSRISSRRPAYSVDKGKGALLVTVVDYGGIEQMGIERVKTCTGGSAALQGHCAERSVASGNTTCAQDACATFRLIQRDNVKVSDLTWSQHDMVEGDELAAHQHRLTGPARMCLRRDARDEALHIAEATVPKAIHRRRLFQTSMSWVDRTARASATRRYATTNSTGCGSIPCLAHGRRGRRAVKKTQT